tara:strand:- start:2384 stop:3946 length:1563 start_codon:yes stop_codon:yes gene_type:complete
MSAQHIRSIKTALISLSDKSGLETLATMLSEAGVRMLSTGNTAKKIRELGLDVTDVADVTGVAEMLDGRVKTLHPNIHGGILADRQKESHLRQLNDLNIHAIDLVAVNLYPFEKTAAKEDVSETALIENIDIGGPTMIRAAAKNHGDVVVLTDPQDYTRLGQELQEHQGTTLSFRRYLALKAFARTAQYDQHIVENLNLKLSQVEQPAAKELRYGENPHQKAWVLHRDDASVPLAQAVPLQGKALSYNNLLDADAAVFSLRCLTDGAPANKKGTVVIKHGSPCGAAWGDTSQAVWQDALSGDPQSAFGGIVATGFEVDGDTAALMAEIFLEVIVAPGFSQEAKDIFARKKNLRLLEIPTLLSAPLPEKQTRSVLGGVLKQNHDVPFTGLPNAQVVTERQPTPEEWAALDLAFRLCTPVRSNAITFTNATKLLGAGGGQTSRVDAVELAVKKSLQHDHILEGAAMGSDAFFPFPDGVEAAYAAGIRAVAQPGGSKKDNEVIARANELGMTMVFTGERHFRH